MTAVDPNWLYATLAQSAAAIVAIVGGFLVSRLISMSAERTGIRKQLADANDELTIRFDQLQRVYATRHSVSVEWFRNQHLPAVVKSSGGISPETLIGEWLPLGAEPSEMRHEAQQLIFDVQSAIQDVDRVVEQGSAARSIENLRAAGLDIEEHLEDVYRAVLATRARRSRPSEVGQTLLGIDNSTFDVTFAPVPDLHEMERQRDRIKEQEDRIKEEDRLSGEVERLRGIRDRLDERMAEIEPDAALYWGVGILAYLAAVGIVLPASLMASRPVPDSMAWRRTALLLFVSGIVSLAAYLWVAIKTLLSDSD